MLWKQIQWKINLKVPKEWKKIIIDVLDLLAHWGQLTEWPDQVTDWYRIYLSKTGISDPQGQTQRVKSAAMVYQMANPHSRFRDSSLTSVHHQKCFHYNNFLSHVIAFLSLRNRGYKKCFLFKVFQDVMIISCAVKLTQARRTEWVREPWRFTNLLSWNFATLKCKQIIDLYTHVYVSYLTNILNKNKIYFLLSI